MSLSAPPRGRRRRRERCPIGACAASRRRRSGSSPPTSPCTTGTASRARRCSGDEPEDEDERERHPSSKSHQNQRANRAPARIATPTTIGATQPVRPRIGLGNPKTLPCQDRGSREHCTSGLKSHERVASGSARRWNRSIVSENAAHQPMTPAMRARRPWRSDGCASGCGHASDYGIEDCADAAPRRRANRRRAATHAFGRESAIMSCRCAAAAPRRITRRLQGDECPWQRRVPPHQPGQLQTE